MNELIPDVFITQLIYRKSDVEFILGYIGEFYGQGVVRKYSKSDPQYMYKGFVHRYKWRRTEQAPWSKKWCTRTQAMEGLLNLYGIDPVWGTDDVLPISETFRAKWYAHL